jgi:hypothetical protein
MITIYQNRTNKVILDVTTDIVNPYFLIRFTNCALNISKIALFEMQSNGSWFIIHIIEVGENGTEDLVNGEIKLGQTGDWEAGVWGQTSSTNLNPNLADEFLGDIDIIVLGDGCSYDNGDTDSCPTITEIDGGDSGSDAQFININGLLDGCNS